MPEHSVTPRRGRPGGAVEGRPGRAVVIGGGVSGLAAGYRLSREGWDVLVLERESEAGGRARTVETGGFLFDTGAQYLRDSYDATLKTAIEVGLGDRLRIPISGVAVFHRGRLVPFRPRSMNPFSALPWGAIGPKGAAGALSFLVTLLRGYRGYNVRFPHLWVEGDRLAASDFLASRPSFDALLPLAEALCCQELGAEPEALSAAAFMVALRMAFADRLGCFTGGIGLLAGSFAERIRVTCGMEALQVVRERSRAVAVKARPTEGGRARSYRADLVVCAVPAPLALGITGELGGAAGRLIAETEYFPEMVVNIGFPGGTEGRSGPVLLPAEERLRARWALTHMSKSIEYAPAGATAITLVYSGREAASLSGEEDGTIFNAALADARKVFGPAGRTPLTWRVDRHELGRPAVTPGRACLLRDLTREGSGIENLLLAGDWTRSPTLEGAISSGLSAAESAILRR